MADPYLQNLDPDRDAADVSLTKVLRVEVVEPVSGVNASTVMIKVEDVLAWYGDAQQSGFTVTKTAITDGFRYDVDRTADYSKQQYVNVYVYAQSSGSGLLNEVYQFSTTGDAPTLSEQDPEPDETDVVKNKVVELRITDGSHNVNMASIILTINGVIAWEDGAEQNGFDIDWTGTAQGLLIYHFYITPPGGEWDHGLVTVEVYAEDTAEVPFSLDTSYSFEVLNDSEAPRVITISPGDGVAGVPSEASVLFSVVDNVQVNEEETYIYVRNVLVYDGSLLPGLQPWTAGWTTSKYSANGATNGYDFVLTPDVDERWDEGETVTIRVVSEDTSGNQLDYSWSFMCGGGLVEYPTGPLAKSVYSMLVSSVRKMDQRSPGVLQKLIKDPGGLDDVWANRIFDRASNLETLQMPEQIPDEWLPWLKSIVGFTRNMQINASESELRRVIRDAVGLWGVKPAENALVTAIRMVTGNPFRIRNYFDFRMMADVTYITEQLEDFDPNLLWFPSKTPSGNQLTLTPSSRRFDIDDLPFTGSTFSTDDQFLWLQVLDFPTDQSLRGTYRIDHLERGDNWGEIDVSYATWPSGVTGIGRWRLLGAHSEYVTEIRLVDKATGSGVVNRELLRFLLDQVRAASERIDIVYVNSLSEFLIPSQNDGHAPWMVIGDDWYSGSVETYIPEPGGYVKLWGTIPVAFANDHPSAVDSSQPPWGLSRMVVFKVDAETTNCSMYATFLYGDSSGSHYEVRLNWGTKTIELWKTIYPGPVDTKLGSTATISQLIPGNKVVVRVELERSGYPPDVPLTNRFRVKVDGETVITASDNAITAVENNIQLVMPDYVTVDEHVLLYYYEVTPLPCTVDRIGPNP